MISIVENKNKYYTLNINNETFDMNLQMLGHLQILLSLYRHKRRKVAHANFSFRKSKDNADKPYHLQFSNGEILFNADLSEEDKQTLYSRLNKINKRNYKNGQLIFKSRFSQNKASSLWKVSKPEANSQKETSEKIKAKKTNSEVEKSINLKSQVSQQTEKEQKAKTSNQKESAPKKIDETKSKTKAENSTDSKPNVSDQTDDAQTTTAFEQKDNIIKNIKTNLSKTKGKSKIKLIYKEKDQPFNFITYTSFKNMDCSICMQSTNEQAVLILTSNSSDNFVFAFCKKSLKDFINVILDFYIFHDEGPAMFHEDCIEVSCIKLTTDCFCCGHNQIMGYDFVIGNKEFSLCEADFENLCDVIFRTKLVKKIFPDQCQEYFTIKNRRKQLSNK